MFEDLDKPKIETGITLESAKADIARNFPELNCTSIEYEGQGMDSKGFVVNHELIFRFAKRDKAGELYDKEAKILPHIQKKISLKIPRIIYRGEQQDGLAIAGHEIIKGEVLQNPTPLQIKQVAELINQLRSIDISEAKSWGMPEKSTKNRYERRLKEARKNVYPILDKVFPKDAEVLKKKIEELYEEFLGNPKNFSYHLSVIHGDLAGHILIDPETKHLTGVIDWGDLHIDDRDYEIWKLYENFGEDFLSALLDKLDHEDLETLRKKLDFFAKAQRIWRIGERLPEFSPEVRRSKLDSLRTELLA